MSMESMELLDELRKHGIGMRKINTDEYAIKDEPKWELYKLED